jgi:uncharacterized protein (TIGR02246 family)
MRSQAESVPHAEITALIADLDAAASALDADRFLGFLAEGPDFAWTFNGHLVTTRAEVRAMHVGSWSKLSRATFRTDVRHVAFVAPGVAVLSATGHSDRTARTGEQRSGDYALLLVLTRGPDGWRVLQGHESTLTR